ncbi:MAG: hypothetical protein JSW65_00015 [Candidatus Bipolaricaulota bacterium]|nr:MAG: hypothetical protein JSW65_00015 [Candidatus Bipolaricaulota bacterium]
MARHLTKNLIAAGIATAVLCISAGGCPPDTIEHHGDVILQLGRPTLLVETCAAESGGVYTFTYRLSNWSGRDLELCALSVPGMGELPTAAPSGPPEWSTSSGVASGCVTWWSWKTAGILLGPGETVSLSLVVDGPASIGTTEAVITFCGAASETAEVLAPSACAGGFPGRFSGCFCDTTTGLCVGTDLFEGEGNRIDLLSGPDEEINGACVASWVRHGFSHGINPDRYAFELTIDGSPVALHRRGYCVPGTDVGNALQAVLWHVQFPEDHFDPGTYEVSGRWLELEEDGSIATIVFERTIRLTVIECMPAYPIPGPTLPDLRARIVTVSCSCGWTPQQDFECEVDVWVEVTNEGGDAGPSSLRVSAGGKSAVRSVPSLVAGASYTAHARIRFETAPGDVGGKCPIAIEARVDYANVVDESDEENNVAATCCAP